MHTLRRLLPPITEEHLTVVKVGTRAGGVRVMAVKAMGAGSLRMAPLVTGAALVSCGEDYHVAICVEGWDVQGRRQLGMVAEWVGQLAWRILGGGAQWKCGQSTQLESRASSLAFVVHEACAGYRPKQLHFRGRRRAQRQHLPAGRFRGCARGTFSQTIAT